MGHRQLKAVVLVAALGALLAGALVLSGCAGQSNQPASNTGDEGIDYMALVNKQNPLPDGWEDALQTVTTKNSIGDDVEVEAKAYDAYLEMKAALEKEGVHVDLDSARRPVADQQRIWDEFTEKYGKEYTETHVAVPGYSEHHTGLALDLYLNIDGKDVIENEDMERYPEVWAKIHAKLADYGFILRYLEGQEDVTGYSYEPWHIRYLDDPKVAKEIMDKGITLEEYLGVADEARKANAEAKAAADAAAANAAAATGFEKDYGTSELYTQADMDAAIDAIMAEFGTWKGAEMKRIAFTDDKTCTGNVSYANELRKDGQPEFDQAIVFTSDFHSPSGEDAKETAWEPDSDYNGWSWYLGRANGGDWYLLTWGYA